MNTKKKIWHRKKAMKDNIEVQMMLKYLQKQGFPLLQCQTSAQRRNYKTNESFHLLQEMQSVGNTCCANHAKAVSKKKKKALKFP